MQVPHGVQKRQSQQQLLDIIGEHCLTQVVNIPTHNGKALDLLFTNAQSPVNRVNGMFSIGKADHDIVYVEYDMKAKKIKRASRKIYIYKRADMVSLKDHMAQFPPPPPPPWTTATAILVGMTVSVWIFTTLHVLPSFTLKDTNVNSWLLFSHLINTFIWYSL